MRNWARQQEDEEEVFDLVGVAEAEGWDQTELMFFVFEYGAEKGVQFSREYYEIWGCKWLMVVWRWRNGLLVGKE